MTQHEPLTDGGSDDPPSRAKTDNSKIDRGARLHEATGGFDEVAKAMFILLVIGIILYIWFIVL